MIQTQQLSVERPRSTSGFSEILHEQKTDTKRRDRPFTAGAPLAKKEEIEQRRVMSAEPQLGSRRGARASTDGWELGGQENLAELESALRSSRKREAKLEKELELNKELEVLVWDGKKAEQLLANQTIAKMKERLKSAKTLLLDLAGQLQDLKDDNVRLQGKISAADKLTKQKLKQFLQHSNEVIAGLLTLVEKVPASSKRTGSGQDRKDADEVAREQQLLLQQIRQSSHAIGDLSESMLGERKELPSDESDDESLGEDAFTTSRLVRTVELIALQLSPAGRVELLEVMRDLFQRFHLVKMEMDALLQTHEEFRQQTDASIRQLMMERSVLRGVIADLMRKDHTGGVPLDPDLIEAEGLASRSDVALVQAQLEVEAIERLEREEEENEDEDEEEGLTSEDAEEEENQGHSLTQTTKELTGNIAFSPSAWKDDFLTSSSDSLRLEEGPSAAQVGPGGVYMPGEWQGEESKEEEEEKNASSVRELKNDDGTWFMGDVRSGRPHGHGSETYPDGSSYEGQFHTGHRDGHGAYYFPDGSVLEGQWKDGLQHGVGIMRSARTRDEPVLVSSSNGVVESFLPLHAGRDTAALDELQVQVLEALDIVASKVAEARSRNEEERSEQAERNDVE
uniref:Uncharacterized protein n=1 Tax=Guillardia theta TaxID=55529 RepID=A0A7S4PR49_GUITH|mmetsp:Transcript_8730/g.29127  ORF Transcript_8730/g.29127 Transcript_8730/m.29127 type:complete len:625 (+) Transcript_8730:641-2515(+)